MADNEQREDKIDYNVKEILDNVDKGRKVSPEDKKKQEQIANAALAFNETIDSVDISDENFKVIFTDGEQQLLYDNGEFFIVSTTDFNKKREKKKRSEARDLYVEYFIKYQLNPILKQKQMDGMVKTITGRDSVQKEQNNLKDKLKANSVQDKLKDEIQSQKEVSKTKSDDRVR